MCARKKTSLINTRLGGERRHQYFCGAAPTQSELIHQNILVHLQCAAGPAAARNPPLRDKKQSNQSNNESIKRPINRSLNQSVGSLLASFTEVSVRSEPQAESLIRATECLTPLTVASGKHTHTHINKSQRTLTDVHAHSPLWRAILRHSDTIQQIKRGGSAKNQHN